MKLIQVIGLTVAVLAYGCVLLAVYLNRRMR